MKTSNLFDLSASSRFVSWDSVHSIDTPMHVCTNHAETEKNTGTHEHVSVVKQTLDICTQLF